MKGKYTGVKLKRDSVGHIVQHHDLVYRPPGQQDKSTWVYDAETGERIIYADWLRDNPDLSIAGMLTNPKGSWG